MNTTVELVDGRGCPDPAIMSQFSYDRITGTAQAKLFSMFKFPESNRVHFQCDIVICKGNVVMHLLCHQRHNLMSRRVFPRLVSPHPRGPALPPGPLPGPGL